MSNVFFQELKAHCQTLKVPVFKTPKIGCSRCIDTVIVIFGSNLLPLLKKPPVSPSGQERLPRVARLVPEDLFRGSP